MKSANILSLPSAPEGLWRVVGIALLLASACALAPQARAAGVVYTCNEAGLKAALFGGGSVTFSCSGTISVAGGTITIATNTSIDGGSNNVTISGGGSLQLFVVNPSTTLRLDHLTIANGNCSPSCVTSQQGVAAGGGAILNNGTLTVDNCSFLNNDTLGLGGAILNNGTMTAENSTFFNNVAENGAAIFASYDAAWTTVNKSTFNGNGALSQGGAIYVVGNLTVVNSTFFANGALQGGSIYNAFNFSQNTGGTAVTVTNSTFAGSLANTGEGGNISNQGPTFILRNTILGGVSSLIPGAQNCQGTFTDGGGNLRWPTSDSSCVGSYGNPQLGPLQNNGGPTQTLALLSGSAAIYTAIESLCPATDQRGVIRPQGPQCDIGAFEYQTALSLIEASLQRLLVFLPNLVSPRAADAVKFGLVAPLSSAVNPDLWVAQDGNHLNSRGGAQVFNLEEMVVNNLSGLIVDQAQLDYIQNVVMSAHGVANTAINDACSSQGSSPVGTSSVGTSPQGACTQANAALAQGDASAAGGNFGAAIYFYANAWQLINQ
jgi:predicted outer membrane repeat protein